MNHREVREKLYRILRREWEVLPDGRYAIPKDEGDFLVDMVHTASMVLQAAGSIIEMAGTLETALEVSRKQEWPLPAGDSAARE